MKTYFYLCFVFGELIAGLYCSPLFENSTCFNNGDKEGICRRKSKCLKIHYINEYHHHNLTRCGFLGKMEVVCCPVETDIRQLPSTRKSEKACDFYAKKFPPNLGPQIWGGEDAEQGEFPYMAALGRYDVRHEEYSFDCGGVLISDSYILTAAHCQVTYGNLPIKIARLGTVDVPKTIGTVNSQFDHAVKKVFVNPEYRLANKTNDIALVQLEKPVTFGPYVQPACLYTNVRTYPQDYLVLGWGEVNRHGSRKERLQKGYVRFESLERCAENLPRDDTRPPLRNTQLCAVHKKTDTCQGDSGGPLQKRFTPTTDLAVIVGITSYGSPTCGSNNPTVYTSVSMYLNWIEGIVWPQDSFL